MDNNFLLTNEIAQELYESIKALPIIDFHNHLNVKDLSSDRNYENITELWLSSDPYKHRAMRILGFDESLITGKTSSAKDKFRAWATALPELLGNPLYHWSMLELKTLFGIENALNKESADAIYESINAQLQSGDFSAQKILKKFNVEYAAPCVGLIDDLQDFAKMSGIVPSLRGDDFTTPTKEFVSSLDIKSLDDYKEFLQARIEVLHLIGCRVADHALDDGFIYKKDDGKNSQRFAQILNNEELELEDKLSLMSEILRFVGVEYGRRDWIMQLHIGALRFTSSKLRKSCGSAGGYAGISGSCDVAGVARLLDDLEQIGSLPQTILFTLNPAHRVALAVLSGSFPRVQLGPAWWYCDHLHGMREVLDTVANYGVLSTFIGMTTDSRSLASFVRHDYYRRMLAVWVSEKVLRNELPSDMLVLKSLVLKMSYTNALRSIKL